MPARLYLDEDVSPLLKDQLRNAGHDVIHVRDIGSRGRSDSYHLQVAATDGRTLVTHNGKHFALLHDAWRRWSQHWGVHHSHGGILCLPQPKTYDRFIAVEAFVRSGWPILNEIYVYHPVRSWLRQPYQP